MRGLPVLLSGLLALAGSACAEPHPADWSLLQGTPVSQGGKALALSVQVSQSGYASVGIFACQRPAKMILGFEDPPFVEGEPLYLDLGKQRFTLTPIRRFGSPAYEGPLLPDVIEAFSTAKFVRLKHGKHISLTLAPPPPAKLKEFVDECRAIAAEPKAPAAVPAP